MDFFLNPVLVRSDITSAAAFTIQIRIRSDHGNTVYVGNTTVITVDNANNTIFLRTGLTGRRYFREKKRWRPLHGFGVTKTDVNVLFGMLNIII